MNKKFTSLMAAALVAGGMSSSAFAADYDVNQYVQLKLSNKLVVVGSSAERDSLAFAKDLTGGAKYDLYEFNQTLWKFVVEAKKGSNGLPNGYNVYLENKVNGSVALTKVDAAADKSLYYAPGAVVSKGRLFIGNIYNADTKKVTADNVNFTGDVVYDAATKTLKYYYLKEKSGVIKLMLATKKLDKADLASETALKTAKTTFKTDCDNKLGAAKVTIASASITDLDVTAEGLNKVGNNAFDLTFNKDVSANAQFGNPFTASSLRAATYKSFKAASYDTETYKKNLKAANETVKALKQIKTDAASLVKEMKVGINYTEYQGSAAAVHSAAPNAEDIKLVKSQEYLGKYQHLLYTGDAATKVADLITAAEDIKYDTEVEGKDVNGNKVTYIVVKDVKAAAKSLDDALKAANEEMDKVIKAVETAVASYDEAVQNSMVSYQTKSTGWVDFTNFAAYNKNDKDNNKSAEELLTNANKLLGDNSKLAFNASDITVTISAANDQNGFYPLEVVGQTDTYVTVDTVYVASKEKYLSLNTVKFDKVAVDGNGEPLAKVVKFDETKKHTYVIVPSKGHNLTPALFKLDVAPLAVGGDKITIHANAPKPTGDATAKYFKDYKDNSTFYDIWTETTSETDIVIRTLAGAREVSVMLPEEGSDVKKNTTITFGEPALATKINDGDIYHVIAMNEAKEANFGKYVVSNPNAEMVFAKEAFMNVPATQWLVKKNNDKYTFENRDFDTQFLVNQKVYVVDEAAGMYTNAQRDTFKLVKIDVEKKGHLGYKFIAEDVQQISEYALSAVNYANMETPYYLTFDGNKDSLLTATPDKSKALALVPMLDKDNKEVTSAYAMNDKNLSKQFYQLISKAGKDTLYLDIKDGELHVTKIANASLLQFRNIDDTPNAYEVLLGAKNDNDVYTPSKKISYNQKGEAVAVATNEATAFVYDLIDNSADIYKNFGFNGTQKVIISLNGDEASKVTKVGPFASVKRTGLELRAAAKDEDFVLVMDTAFVDHKDNIRYAYYITKPIDSAKFAWNDEKFYMVSYQDSVDANVSNDTIKYSQDGLTRVGFVPAKRVDADKLAISKVKATEKDTINVTEKLGVTNATFAFAIDENDENAYRIESNKGKYVSYLNGILVIGNKPQAQLFNVTTTELNPTENESIEAEGVKVLGQNGSVVVLGAAGKNVTVATVLGKTVASQVIASDNATIAAPAGVVFVTVDGETTKVVVK